MKPFHRRGDNNIYAEDILPMILATFKEEVINTKWISFRDIVVNKMLPCHT